MHSTQSLTVRTSAHASLRQFLWLCTAFALLKLAIQVIGNILSQHAGYGIFRDEMYYLICGRHLAFGYVDQPPLTALQARVSEMLFGYHHMWSLRLITAFAGGAKVFLTGLIVRALGGSRGAAALAMLGVITVGVYLGIDGYLSMNSFEPVFWMTCALCLIHIVRADEGRTGAEKTGRNAWIVLGISAGLGLENKANIVFFLVTALAALLLTPQRRILWNRWFAVSTAILVILALPNLLWQIHYHFPTLEWLNDVRHSDKDVKLAPFQFLLAQAMMLTPWTVFLWLSGVLWLLIAKAAHPFRFFGLFYLLFVPLMMAFGAKDYYLAPVYPLYFAAGAICWLTWSAKATWRNTVIGLYAVLLIAGFILFVPFAIPILPPQQYLAWSKTMHFQPKDSENHSATVLPQFYADRFGWQEMVEKTAAVYNALPASERAVTGIFTGNYGEASAINLYGPKYGLPVAISGHQNYWMWGPHGYTGQEMIIIQYSAKLESLKRYYASCTLAGQLDHPLSMPWEKDPIYLCRGRKTSYAADWKNLKFYY